LVRNRIEKELIKLEWIKPAVTAMTEKMVKAI
jgi:hypothetical protein